MSITRYKLTVCLRTDSPLHSGGIDEVVDRTRPSEKRETLAHIFYTIFPKLADKLAGETFNYK